MAVLAEQDSGSAARILAAARELVLKRGVKGLTIAEIAERAHVAKGTVYLHWSTREDLLVGLFARDFLAMTDTFATVVADDPDVCRPSRLLPMVMQNAVDRPFVRALQIEDDDMLGALTQHPRSTKLREELGPGALMYAALPVWREHNLARTDWALDEQAYALHALLSGFLNAATQQRVLNTVSVDDPARVLAAATTALLGPETPSPEDIRATADAALAVLTAKREAVLESIGKRED
ncbi:TetR/AcrR family transcriptional regulator [Kutzneria sp. CA-103260]|uniref:TetR/AcrR family transcriptional regulator n=1 Tax=Kutzneria sp. CA-103260 TaxID=2802641 RepID=UPI001BA6EB87|nr:helix-turn-helix domain-containing protein [Kutzneria sp. CA-103260]QUQ69116.1 TetR family transcriptional regulator [Kutzneria sp. CA-103260]